MTEDELDVIRDTYKGHEISCHTVHHGFLNRMLPISIVNEVVEDRRLLEHIAGYPVVGMSYPYGTYDDKVIGILRSCGIVYSRTTGKDSHPMELPKDFLVWHPTCHHKDVGQYIDSFIKNISLSHRGPLFYIWGHSYEFDTEEKWAELEGYIARLAEQREKIWFATNIEIYNYVKAQHSLIVSADEKIIYNPSAIDVWVKKDSDIVKIEGNGTRLYSLGLAKLVYEGLCRLDGVAGKIDIRACVCKCHSSTETVHSAAAGDKDVLALH
jgi:hypothetical protein